MYMLDNTIIPIELDGKTKRHSYIIINNYEAILIDPGTRGDAQQVLDVLKKNNALKLLKAIVIQNSYPDTLGALEVFKEKGFDITVIAKRSELDMLASTGLKIQSLESLDYVYTFNNNETLTFIETPFLPYPESFVTFYSGRNILFSATLFSQSDLQNTTVDDIKNATRLFHESYLPSSDFLRPVLKVLRKYPLKLVYPKYGTPLRGETLRKIMDWISRIDFYNTQQVVYKKTEKRKVFNYIAICNHMLKKLETVYERNRITRIFTNSHITLEKTPSLEISETNLNGYKLYNYFFDMLYQKEGVTWLGILEPMVKKYHKMYKIKQPAIYTSKLYIKEKQIQTLDAEKTSLLSEVESLNKKINETTDQLLRCPITELYNERFMKQHMINALKTDDDSSHNHGIFFIIIDDLDRINKRFGKQVGDETLRSLVYTINQHKEENMMVFKQNGPGIIIHDPEASLDSMRDFAGRLLNSVRNSTVFIDKTTISIALVHTAQIDEQLGTERLINHIFELGTLRIERAKNKGHEQIIDQSSDTEDFIEGKILLIDEDETNRNLMMKIFSRIHFDVVIASDIYEALNMLEWQTIDVIISEINLSKLDGYQFKQKLNESKALKQVPFIIASHHKTKEVINRCNILGVDVVLQKPIMPEEIIGFVKRFKERRMIG